MNRMQRTRIIWALTDWEMETHKQLPMKARRIADIELAGGIVDLETGEILYPKQTETKPDAAPQL